MKKRLYGIIAVFILCVIDQWSKWWAVLSLKNEEARVILKDILHFSYLENTGAAFGSFMGMRLGLIIITFIVLGLLIWKYNQIPYENKYLCMRTCIILLISGAIGNLIDRLLRGYVVDFIYFVPIDFPKFNIADSYIVISLIIMVIALFSYYDEKELDNLISIKSGWENSN